MEKSFESWAHICSLFQCFHNLNAGPSEGYCIWIIDKSGIRNTDLCDLNTYWTPVSIIQATKMNSLILIIPNQYVHYSGCYLKTYIFVHCSDPVCICLFCFYRGRAWRLIMTVTIQSIVTFTNLFELCSTQHNSQLNVPSLHSSIWKGKPCQWVNRIASFMGIT
jgi:hypothetical protein